MTNETRGRDIFYGVVAVATLIVAIVGATLAYFSITASSGENAVNAMSANVSISYDDGQQVSAQADQLIPAKLDVVKSVYEAKVKTSNTNTKNMCLDDKNQQVCSVYRFTIGSNVSRAISATLNNEKNEFEYLSYAVYDVTKGEWVNLGDDSENPVGSFGLKKCSNEDNDNTITDCHSTDKNNVKKYNNDAVNSIFGKTSGGKFQTKKLEIPEGVTTASQTYDLILFIKENNDNQNIDQGKQYLGKIIIEVTDENASGQITGFLNQTTTE